MMTLNKKLYHNNEEYIVSVRLKPQLQIEVNGKLCSDVRSYDKNRAYYAYIPNAPDIIIIIYNKQVYLFDIDANVDITEFVKGKIVFNINIVERLVISLLMFIPFFTLGYSLMGFPRYRLLVIFNLLIYYIILKNTEIYVHHPTVSKKNKRIVAYTVSIASFIVVTTICLLVLGVF